MKTWDRFEEAMKLNKQQKVLCKELGDKAGLSISLINQAFLLSNIGTITFIKSPRAKYQRITIRPDKSIIVTIPRGGSLSEAKQFLITKTSWIQKQLYRINKRAQQQNIPDLSHQQ